ncbi:MAG: YbaK/EbsC family protein [Marinobacterium sp.]|nr:YbaK/EbsC family protein [Marinobacterium sp.]
MSLAPRVESFLRDQHINWQSVEHPYAETAMDCAIAARIPPQRVAKGVLLADDEGFYMAVIPADKQVNLSAVSSQTNRLLDIAHQKDAMLMFNDCREGAIPSMGQAYRLPVIWDDGLVAEPDCYMECGDHEHLLRVDRTDFMKMMGDARHGNIAH